MTRRHHNKHSIVRYSCKKYRKSVLWASLPRVVYSVVKILRPPKRVRVVKLELVDSLAGVVMRPGVDLEQSYYRYLQQTGSWYLLMAVPAVNGDDTGGGGSLLPTDQPRPCPAFWVPSLASLSPLLIRAVLLLLFTVRYVYRHL